MNTAGVVEGIPQQPIVARVIQQQNPFKDVNLKKTVVQPKVIWTLQYIIRLFLKIIFSGTAGLWRSKRILWRPVQKSRRNSGSLKPASNQSCLYWWKPGRRKGYKSYYKRYNLSLFFYILIYYFQDNLRDTTKIPDITVQSPTPEKVILKPVQSPSLPTPFGSGKQEETGKFLRPRLSPVEEPSTQISSIDTRKDEKLYISYFYKNLI